MSLSLAAKQGHVTVIQILLEAGASPNTSGDSPLIEATRGNHVPAVKILLEAGADANHKNAMGRNALSYAKEHKNAELISLLRTKTKRFGLF